MKDFARGFYRTKAWKDIRELAMARDSRLCQDCLIHGRITPAEEVHHIKELTPQNINDPEIALNLSNLVCLCRECHKARHKPQFERYTVDEFGRIRTRGD